MSSQILAQEKSKHQSDVIIDPIFISCWNLDPDSSIRPAKLNSQYFGRIIVEAEGDSINLRLIKFDFLFVKLKSKINIYDSIEIRMNSKLGNYQAFDSLKLKIIEHLSYLQIKSTNYKDCNKQPIIYTIPVNIE